MPLGTANLAARALGIPSRIGGSLATAFGGHERRIDLAVAGGAVAGTAVAGAAGAMAGAGAMGGARAMVGAGELTFAAMAGIGLDAEVVAATPRLLEEAGPAGSRTPRPGSRTCRQGHLHGAPGR